jgi:hypothetical protein
MSYQRLGFTGHHLYRLGWNHSHHKNLSQVQHWLLSSLYYYRRGFIQAQVWREQIFQERASG